ncbi:MAG: hypothetical protein U9N58_10470, partial [Thermodesulfobacteriota bacterium]|nr:hypothetical protein [Thermodesulfobacteriota bacterium]
PIWMSEECSSQARDGTPVELNSPGCNQLIDVVVPLPIYMALTYILSGHTLFPPKGSRVLVPVGRSSTQSKNQRPLSVADTLKVLIAFGSKGIVLWSSGKENRQGTIQCKNGSGCGSV